MVLPIGAKERNQTKFDEKHLTTSRLYGLMRPVARIAQSVEQGIENPRVLGSIPSPGTTYSENPPKRRVFAFPGVGLSIELRSIIRRQRLTPSGPARQARCSTPAALVRVRAPLIQRTRPKGGFLLFRESDSPSNCVRLFAASGSPLRGQRARRAAGGVAEYRGATASNKAAILPGMITARPISGKRATQQSSAIKLTIKPGSTASGDLSNNIIGSTAQLALSFIFYAIACRHIIEKTIRDSGYYE